MKKKFLLRSRFNYCFTLFAFFVLLTNMRGLSQNLPLSGFVIYANSDTTSQGFQHGSSTNCGVEIHNNSKILSGNVGSAYSVTTTGPVNINGGIHSAGTISLAW